MRRNVKLGHPTFQGQTRCRKTLGQQIATYDKHTIAIATVGQSQARLTTLFPPNYSHIISHINETSCSNYNAERRTNNPKPPTPALQKQMPARLARHHLHQANKKHQFPLQPGQEGRRQPGKLHKRTHLPHHCPLQLLHLLQVQPRLLRYKAKDPSKHIVKAKLFMFDAFSEKDIQIQISIPGSMEVKCFNLRGETLSFNAGDYERAYYSSFLRSLYPMNYPGIILYHLINRIEILKPIIKNFIAFAARHELRELNNQLQPQRRIEFEEGEQSRNLSLQILVKYLIQNGFGNLLKVVMDELKKQKSQKYYQIEMEWKLKEKKYTQILYKTAQKLLINPHINQLKEFQIKALNRVGKSLQIAFIGRTLIESGGTNDQISSIILRSLIETNQDKRYLKSLNLLLNFSNSQQRKLLQVSHIHKNNSTIRFGEQMKNIKCISECSELCFPFDNAFLNRTSEFLGKRDILQKNSKEGFTYNIIQKVEESLENNPVFYETLIYYVKQRGWANLVKIRANCFWLESDFHIQSESLRNKHFHSKFDDNYSFFQRNFQKEQQMEEADVQVPSSEERQEQINQLQHQSAKLDNIEDNNSDFEGNLSQHEFSKEIQEPPKCSARVNLNIKFNQQERKGENKIQCCLQMQQLFFALYHDLKLQNSLESWQQRLKQADDSTLSPIKKEIAALIYLKKGFLNRKLLQSRKCEQAFRSVKKLTQSFSLNLVATYQLILLYIQKKNVKGVEFYLVELVKVLKNMGIDTIDVVPEWAKPILQFIVDHQGLSIVKNIHPVFKYVFGFYLRSNLSEQEVNEVLKIKK